MGKELVVQCTAVLLRRCRICTVIYENGERTKTVPNKPLWRGVAVKSMVCSMNTVAVLAGRREHDSSVAVSSIK